MPESNAQCRWKNCLWLALGILFAISHTWSPLYYSNQNQYFVHGLAQAGVGNLKGDWLANTRDPTPIFSMFVEGVSQTLGHRGFQAFFALLLVTYFTALMWLLDGIAPNLMISRKLLVAGLLFTIHSAMFRYLLAKLFGIDYLWYFQCGVAGQYVLGPGLQPSVFGVFLVVAIAAYANDRPVSAILCSSLAAISHATYLLPAGLFTLGVMFDQYRRGRTGRAIGLGLSALLLVVPTLVYLWRTFQPTDQLLFGIGQDILVNTRIPHHARIDCWFDIVAGLQLIWIAIGIILLRGSRIFVVLTMMVTGAIILTIVQWWTRDTTLALLFPWRVSAILVPIATITIVSALSSRMPPLICYAVAAGLIIFSVAGAIYVFGNSIGYAVTEAEHGLIDHVARKRDLGHTYLLPVRIPNLKSEPAGSQSLTFNARPRPANVIPWDFQRFRLATGARTYVDFKSIPYADVDVIEWYRRMQNAERWFKQSDWNSPRRLWELEQENITHIVTPADVQLPAEHYHQEFADDYYRLYRITP